MPLRILRLACLCALLLALALAAQAQTLAPQAKRDLAVLATAYPGVMTAIEVDPAGRATVVLTDGTRLPYDDGRAKSQEELLGNPDLEDMLAQPYPLGPVVAEPPLHFLAGPYPGPAAFPGPLRPRQDGRDSQLPSGALSRPDHGF